MLSVDSFWSVLEKVVSIEKNLSSMVQEMRGGFTDVSMWVLFILLRWKNGDGLVK